MVCITRKGEKDFQYTVDPLFASISVGKSKVEVTDDAVLLVMKKKKKGHWDKLAGGSLLINDSVCRN